MLVGQQIFHAYGSREILYGVDLCIPRGSITGLLGPSGSGKSTLLRFLSGLELPRSGTVLIQNSVDGARSVAVVFQKLALWPHMTILENIFFPVRHNISRNKLRRCAEYIRRLGLQRILKQYPSQCSLGEQQRAALVRALGIDPEFLLLDEPTSALDSDTAAIVESILQEERSRNLGILLITHDRLLLNRISDRSYLLSNGSVKEIELDLILKPYTSKLTIAKLSEK